MNKTDLLRQIAKSIVKAAKGVDPKVATNGAKMANALARAKLADDLILDKIPGLKSAMVWADDKISAGQHWLVENTLGKIPGVGPVLSKLHQKGIDTRHKIRDALFGGNDPQWYEHLPQHVPFTIPGSYNNKVIKFDTSNGTNTSIPSVATFEMVRNMITTPYATASRYSEIYTAVKYARGLSYLPYTMNQLAIMFEIGNELTVLYYRIAKAVSAAFHFSLTKANLPDAIISGLGFTDIIPEYANYVTLLDQMYNYMSVNVPLLPIMHNKLRQMCLFTALDSEKPAMSTYLQARIFTNDIHLTEDGLGFYSNGVDLPSNLQSCRNKFSYFMDMLSSNNTATSQMLNIIADVKGSIAGVVYIDNWRNIKFEGTFTTDPTFLNSLKNIDLVPTMGLVVEDGNSTSGFVCDQFKNASQGSSSNPILLSTGKEQDIVLRFGSANKATTASSSPKYVCCSGSKDVKTFAESVFQLTSPYSFDLSKDEYRNEYRLVSLDGTEDSEGRTLEVLSLSAVTKSCSIEAPSNTTPCYVNITVASSLFVCTRIEVANKYTDKEVTYIKNFLGVPGWVDDIDYAGIPTAWTLVDWMPYIKVSRFFSAATYYITTLWDINGIGVLSATAINTAIDYITYSLLYPGAVEALNKVELANKLISSLKTK